MTARRRPWCDLRGAAHRRNQLPTHVSLGPSSTRTSSPSTGPLDHRDRRPSVGRRPPLGAWRRRRTGIRAHHGRAATSRVQDRGADRHPRHHQGHLRDDAMLRDALLRTSIARSSTRSRRPRPIASCSTTPACTQEELAGRIGRSRPQVTNTSGCSASPLSSLVVGRRRRPSAGHARALLPLDDAAAMERLAQRDRRPGPAGSLGRGDRRARGLRGRPRGGPQAPRRGHVTRGLTTSARRARGPARHPGPPSAWASARAVTVEFASYEDLVRIVRLMGVEPR